MSEPTDAVAASSISRPCEQAGEREAAVTQESGQPARRCDQMIGSCDGWTSTAKLGRTRSRNLAIPWSTNCSPPSTSIFTRVGSARDERTARRPNNTARRCSRIPPGRVGE